VDCALAAKPVFSPARGLFSLPSGKGGSEPDLDSQNAPRTKSRSSVRRVREKGGKARMNVCACVWGWGSSGEAAKCLDVSICTFVEIYQSINLSIYLSISFVCEYIVCSFNINKRLLENTHERTTLPERRAMLDVGSDSFPLSLGFLTWNLTAHSTVCFCPWPSTKAQSNGPQSWTWTYTSLL
jgi:hypothetical protein